MPNTLLGKWNPFKKKMAPSVEVGPMFVDRKSLRDLLNEWAKSLTMVLQVDGAAELRETEEGFYIRLAPGGATLEMHAWKAREVSGALVMAGGSYNGVAIGQTTLTGSGDRWAYLRVDWDVTDVENGYVMSAALTDAAVYTGTSVPADEPLAGSWYIPLVQYNGLTVLSQAEVTSLTGQVCDDGTGEETAQHTLLR